MWKFFEWAWSLSWSEGFALLAVLFAFWYGKKWIDSRFSGMNNKQRRELKAVFKEALHEWESEVEYLGRPGYKWENNEWVKNDTKHTS